MGTAMRDPPKTENSDKNEGLGQSHRDTATGSASHGGTRTKTKTTDWEGEREKEGGEVEGRGRRAVMEAGGEP